MERRYKIWIVTLIMTCCIHSGFSQSNIIISGKLNYNEEGTITIENNRFGSPGDPSIASAIVDKSGSFQFKFNIDKPQVVRLFNRPFYITPGDSVFTNCTGGNLSYPLKLAFKGRNADPYIYAMKYDSLKTALNYKFFEYDFKGRLINYLDQLNANKKILLNNLNDFIKNHTLSDEFRSYAFNQIVYAYYAQLLFPLTNKTIPVEQIPLPYSTILDQIKLNNDSVVFEYEYEITAIHLIDYKKDKNKESQLQAINENATGLTKEFLLTYYADILISAYSPKDSLETKELFEKIDKGVTNPEIRKSFSQAQDQLIKYLTPFPKEVLLSTLIDSTGHKLTFRDLLMKSKNKFIVLDFWASWCGPCRVGMPKVNKLKKSFSNKDVKFVFISIDDTEKEWRSGLKMTKVPGNHYWPGSRTKSALAKYLKIQSIPRYVIINRLGRIEKMKAFSPSEEYYGLMEELTKLLNH